MAKKKEKSFKSFKQLRRIMIAMRLSQGDFRILKTNKDQYHSIKTNEKL